jgi:hypothetical protein
MLIYARLLQEPNVTVVLSARIESAYNGRHLLSNIEVSQPGALTAAFCLVKMPFVPFPDMSGLRSTGRDAKAVIKVETKIPSENQDGQRWLALLSIIAHHYLAHEKAGITFICPAQSEGHWKQVSLELGEQEDITFQQVVELVIKAIRASLHV